MDFLLFLMGIGMYGSFFVGIIWLIYALIRKRHKKPGLILLGIALAILIAVQFVPEKYFADDSDGTRSAKTANDSSKKEKAAASSKKVAESKKAAAKASSESKHKKAQAASKSSESEKMAAKKAADKKAKAQKKALDESKRKAAAESSKKAAEAKVATSTVALGKKLHKVDSDVAGVTKYNGVLTVVMKKSVATKIIDLKLIQEKLLKDTINVIAYASKSPMASNGVLVVGGYIKDDVGPSPVMSVYYDKSALTNAGYKPNYLYQDDALDLFTKSTCYYLYGMYLKNATDDHRGIFEGFRTSDVYAAPNWFENILAGDDVVKADK